MSNSQGPISDCEHVSTCAACDNYQKGHQFLRRYDTADVYMFYCTACVPVTSKLFEHDCISELIPAQVPHSEGCPYDVDWKDIFDRIVRAVESAPMEVELKSDRFECARPSCADPFAMRWIS
jgi:hypothetical protein